MYSLETCFVDITNYMLMELAESSLMDLKCVKPISPNGVLC